MQKIMFGKVEGWVILLLALLLIPFLIIFGAAVLDAERGDNRFGSAGKAALAAAEVPDMVRTFMHEGDSIVIWNSQRFADKPTGWTFGPSAAGLPDGYLLFSRYDGTLQRHVVELVELRTGKVLYTWRPDGDTLLANASRASVFPTYWAWDSVHFREIHPVVLESGDLIVKDHNSPLFRIDACSRPVWMIDSQVFHHSSETDADGNIWVPGVVEPPSVERVPRDFFEDNVVKVSPDGEILFERSLTDLLIDAGYDYRLFSNGMYNFDPTHLNDIEPALADGPHWKKGDLFLSVRNISAIVLYRPSEDRILWMKSGPWVSQHDVDILDDHRIAIYDNNAQDRGGQTYFDGHSDISVYDFETDAVTHPWSKEMADSDIKTAFAGLFTALPGGYAMVEDVTNARFMIFAPDHSVAADFINRAEDGRIFHLGWTRYLDRGFGDRLLENLKKVNCDA